MGYTLNKTDTKVNIDLENGIYVFNKEAATGKTRLLKLLSEKVSRPEIVIYTYTDYLKGLTFDIAIQHKKNPKLVLIDRYDMYNGKFGKTIAGLENKAIVLIDCKTNLLVPIECYPQVVHIQMMDTSIHVGVLSGQAGAPLELCIERAIDAEIKKAENCYADDGVLLDASASFDKLHGACF